MNLSTSTIPTTDLNAGSSTIYPGYPGSILSCQVSNNSTVDVTEQITGIIVSAGIRNQIIQFQAPQSQIRFTCPSGTYQGTATVTVYDQALAPTQGAAAAIYQPAAKVSEYTLDGSGSGTFTITLPVPGVQYASVDILGLGNGGATPGVVLTGVTSGETYYNKTFQASPGVVSIPIDSGVDAAYTLTVSGGGAGASLFVVAQQHVLAPIYPPFPGDQDNYPPENMAPLGMYGFQDASPNWDRIRTAEGFGASGVGTGLLAGGLYGYDATNSVFRRLLCDTSGNLITTSGGGGGGTGMVLFKGNTGTVVAGGTAYIGTNLASITEATVRNVVQAGTWTKLAVRQNAAPGAGNSTTWTLYKNGVATSLTVTVSNTNTTGTVTGSVTTVEGDTLSMQLSQSASAATISFAADTSAALA